MTRLTFCVVLLSIGCCTLRYSLAAQMSPAQDARDRQIREALEVASKLPQAWPCVWVSERVCVSPEMAKRVGK